MEKKFAIFDMDGTLTDSMGVWNHLAEEYITGLGYVYSPQVMERTSHLTVLDSAVLFVEYYHIPKTPEQTAREINALMEKHYRSDVPLKPGAADFLARLKGAGFRMCIASSTNPALIDICLRRLGVRDYFEFLLSCEEVGEGKNRPTVYLEAARRLGGTPENTVVFEDILVAAQTAKKAGFSLGVIYDANSHAEQPQLKQLADCYFTRWDDPKLAEWMGLS